MYFTFVPVTIMASVTLIMTEAAGNYGPGLSLKPNPEMEASYKSSLYAPSFGL